MQELLDSLFPYMRSSEYAALARLDAPGVLHHVMGRGIERRKIFINKKDRNDFISRLAELAEGNAMDIYTWALLPNHFHILCKTKMRPLSASMRKVLTGYVVNFNKRHKRHGHLFQNPYKSIVCEEDVYLMDRDIHLTQVPPTYSVSGYGRLSPDDCRT